MKRLLPFKNSNIKNTPYRRIIVGTVYALLLAIVCMSVFSYFTLSSTMHDTFHYFVSGSAYMAINDVENLIYDFRNIANEIANNHYFNKAWYTDEITTDDFNGMSEFLEQYRKITDIRFDVFIYNADNDTISFADNSFKVGSELFYKTYGLNYLLPAINNKSINFDEFILKSDSGYSNRLCLQYFPVANSNNSIIITIGIDSFVKKLLPLDMYDNSYYILLNKDNKPIYSNISDENIENKILKSADESLFKTDNKSKDLTISGEEYITSYFSAKSYEFKLLTSVPKTIAYTNKTINGIRMFFAVIIVLLLIIIVLVIAIWYLSVFYREKQTNDYLNMYNSISFNDEKQSFLLKIIEEGDDDFIKTLPDRDIAVFLHGIMIMVLVRLNGTEQNISPEENKMHLQAVLNRTFDAYKIENILLDDDLTACMLIKVENGLNQEAVKRLLKDAEGMYENGTFASAISDKVTWRELKNTYDALLDQLDYIYIYGKSAVITPDMIIPDSIEETRFDLMPKILEVKLKMAAGFITEADNMFDELWSEIICHKPNKVRTYMFFIFSIFADVIELMEKRNSTFFDFDYTEELTRMTDAKTADDAHQIFKGYINKMNFTQTDNNTEHQKFICKQIKEFIADNYGDVSLGTELIANHIGASVSYIGKLFKKVEGITILNYILKFRMNKALELLENRQDLTVNQISKMLGYSTTSYFGSLFKKEFKISPGLYRERVLNSNSKNVLEQTDNNDL